MIGTAHAGLGITTILAVATIGLFAAVMAAALSDVDFATDDGLDVALAGFVEEIRSGKEIAVIGDGHGWHFLARRFIEKLRSLANPLEQTLIRMNAEMDG